MSANKNLVRGTLCVFLFASMAGAAAVGAKRSAAREDPLQDAVAALAKEVLAIGDVRGPLRIDWRNDSSISAGQSAALQDQFAARLSAVRGLISEDPAAPLLRVTLRDTPTQLIAIARVPAADGEQVRMVQVSRMAFIAQDLPQVTPFLRKQLLWKQREPILDAVERSMGAANLLVILGRETVWTYDSARDPLQLQGIARVPGPVRSSRSLAGRLRFANEADLHFTVELPGKTCSGNVAERMALQCVSVDQRAPGNSKARSAQDVSDVTGLIAPCDHSSWTLSSGDADWSKADGLFLRDNRSAGADRIAALDLPGPVLTLENGPQGVSSIAVVLNLSTGEYEIYRLALACHN